MGRLRGGSNTGSKICTQDSSGERIGRCRADEGTYQSRLAGPLREAPIGDPRIIRLIQKWLRAGILEDGS